MRRRRAAGELLALSTRVVTFATEVLAAAVAEIVARVLVRREGAAGVRVSKLGVVRPTAA